MIEHCHSLGYQQPIFKLANEKQSENISEFQIELVINKISYWGTGDTKKNAEVDAAKHALKEIENY